jgi:hypothetical protein
VRNSRSAAYLAQPISNQAVRVVGPKRRAQQSWRQAHGASWKRQREANHVRGRSNAPRHNSTPSRTLASTTGALRLASYRGHHVSDYHQKGERQQAERGTSCSRAQGNTLAPVWLKKNSSRCLPCPERRASGKHRQSDWPAPGQSSSRRAGTLLRQARQLQRGEHFVVRRQRRQQQPQNALCQQLPTQTMKAFRPLRASAAASA